MDNPSNLAAPTGTPGQGQLQEDPASRILDFKFSIREATMILNKLNVATFNGFPEASQAMQIFAKVQATVANDNMKPQGGNKTVPFKPPVAAPPMEETSPNTGAPMAPVPPKAVSEESNKSAEKVKDDVPPPEDAGVFSVIDKRGDI